MKAGLEWCIANHPQPNGLTDNQTYTIMLIVSTVLIMLIVIVGTDRDKKY